MNDRNAIRWLGVLLVLITGAATGAPTIGFRLDALRMGTAR